MNSYKVISLYPFSIEGSTVESGAACGDIFLNKGFESLLHRKLGAQANSILTRKRLKYAIRYFDRSIKYSFPYDEYCDTEYDVPLPGAPDVLAIGLEDGYLKLSKFRNSCTSFNARDDIQSVFRPIFDKIYDLINQKMLAVEAISHRNVEVLNSRMHC